MDEILNMALKEIVRSGYEDLAGIVFDRRLVASKMAGLGVGGLKRCKQPCEGVGACLDVYRKNAGNSAKIKVKMVSRAFELTQPEGFGRGRRWFDRPTNIRCGRRFYHREHGRPGAGSPARP